MTSCDPIVAQVDRQVKVMCAQRVTTVQLAPPFPRSVGREPSAMSLDLTHVWPAQLASTVSKVCHSLF